MTRRPRSLVLAAALAAAAVLPGCAGTGDGDGRPGVVATTTQLGDLVREVGGPAIDVHQILQPNTDPHEYEPRPDDVRQTAGAKVVFVSGDRLDGWMGKVVEQSGGDPRVVDLAPRSPRRDPHWWQDPRAVVVAVRAIRAALVRADPAHRAAYDRRAARYTARVRALEAAIARCLGRVPRRERRLVTSHDAFGPFARRYGITIVGTVIPSQTTEAQPSAGELSRLARLVRRTRVKAIFPETSVPAKLAQALARATGARADLELYGDTLGPRDGPAGTYLGMERVNADRIMTGLTGDPRGCGLSE